MKANPRLLIILNRFVIGGQAADTIPLAWHLKSDFEILILYGEKESDEVEPLFLLEMYPGLRMKKVKYLRRSVNPFIDLVSFFKLLLTISRFKPHIVHTHGAKSGFIGRLASWFTAVPVIVHTFHGHFFHSYFSPRISKLIAGVERQLGKITTAAIALSRDQKTELTEKYAIIPERKIQIIPLGCAFTPVVDADILRNSFREKYGLQPDDVAIGIVGRIVPVKNHSFFVDVVQRLLNGEPKGNPAFFVVGDGDVRKQVELELQQKNISFNSETISSSNRVVFTSWLTDMYEVMNGLDVILLTSLNEGTPLSIIEAQFFKRPVVSTNVGGVKDTMLDGITGFLTDPTDVATFSEKLRLLIESKELRLSMGEEGNRFVSEKFSKEKEIASTKQFYFSLLAQKGYHFNQQPD